MQNLNILNKKEIKKVLSAIKNQWGCDVFLDFIFLQSDKGKIYIIDKKFGEIDASKLRINALGLYFGELGDNGLRLSIEGSQLIGSFAKKNIIELNEEQMRAWMAGDDLQHDGNWGFVLIKHNNDFLGCGKLRDGKLYNYVGKARRIEVIN